MFEPWHKFLNNFSRKGYKLDALTLYNESYIWDDHCGFETLPDAPLDPLLKPWRDANINYLSINVGFDPKPWTRTVENIAALRKRLPLEAPDFQLVATTADIDRVRLAGNIAVTFDIEGMTSLNGQLEMVQFYYDLGVRHMLIAYNRNNEAGSGCHDEDIGLSDFGAQVIEEMNRVGMVVDLAHSGYRATMLAMEISSAPVVFSHANAQALADHGRNITDDQIKACAATGGVIGINGINLFLGEERATPELVAKHAAYMSDLTGPEHVGISLDYADDLSEDKAEESSLGELLERSPHFWPESAGYSKMPITCLDVRRLPNVTQCLLDVGFTETDVVGILGGNFRRVADQVWKA